MGSESPSIDLTPLIDIVFCILIVFIVLAPLIELDQISLASGPRQKKQEELSQTTIYVNEHEQIKLNQAVLSLDELRSRLKQERKKGGKLSLFHDKRASFGMYQNVKRMAQEAGFEQLDVVLSPS